MDFTISPRIEDFRARIARFVEDEILPLEADRASYDPHENIRRDLLDALRDKAKGEGLWCLQLKQETGGQGLDKVGMAVCYEEMNRSIFGPVVFNAPRPTTATCRCWNGRHAGAERALVGAHRAGQGAIGVRDDRTASRAGSDPGGMMLTTATRKGDRYVIQGRKWFITGAEEAEHFILVARTSDDPRKGLTAFLFTTATSPGWRIERRIPIMGPEEHGGHCEIVFEGWRYRPGTCS
jgi:acyl-CoA dehydrogenase